jgi:hypothetical protein
MTPRALVFGGLVAVAGLPLGAGGCSDTGFGTGRGARHLVVELVAPSDPASPDKPLPLSPDKPVPFRVVVRALLPDGSVDAAFTSYVRLSAKPGAIQPINEGDAQGRNVLLKNGVSDEVDVQVGSAFGTTFIVADDLGYIPADPLRSPPPACANGVDDDGNGLVDFPADTGCAFANDDSELGGTYEQGVSAPIYFKLPRIADARGLKCDASRTCSGGGATPYPKEQLLLDTGFVGKSDAVPSGFAFDVVVTRIASNGFYMTDTSDSRRACDDPKNRACYTGYNSLFSFNFNPPPRMRICDRLKSLAGTAGEFFGFTQLSYPTWTLEEWDPSLRPCLVPEPIALRPGDVVDKDFLNKASASLVRVETQPDRAIVSHVAKKLGPGDVPKVGATYTPSEEATNCDYDHDNKIDFSPGSTEADCSNACTADVECVEYSNFKARSTFRIVVASAGDTEAIQADASAASGFDVIASRGKELRSFTGTLTFFSGGAQYTIEARCDDDIVVDTAKDPIPVDKACVLPRTILELNPQ